MKYFQNYFEMMLGEAREGQTKDWLARLYLLTVLFKLMV